MGLDDFTSDNGGPEIRRNPADWGVEGPVARRCYVFSIHQSNWQSCADGPDCADTHGEENINKPWQGVGRGAKINPRHLTPGTVVVARRASRGGNKKHGAKGLWRYRSCARITDQSQVPWSDDLYDWVLYCERIQPDFVQAIDDKIRNLPFYQTKFQGAVKTLRGENCRAYLSRLLSSGALNKDGEKAVRNDNV